MNSDEGKSVELTLKDISITVNYPGKLYWPEKNITRLDLVHYYQSMAEYMLPYLHARPLTLKYYPRGIKQFSFYRRDLSTQHPAYIKTFPYQEVSQNKTIQLPIVENSAGLLWFMAKGAIEVHLWSAIIPDIFHADMVIFDLDIADENQFDQVLSVAEKIYQLLEQQNISVYAKTTGGSGLHLYVPISPVYPYQQIRSWVQNITEKVRQHHPELIENTSTRGQTHHSKGVTIDYRQNTLARNTAAPYTVRATPDARVSMPVSWEEIKKGQIRPSDFNLKNALQRVKQTGDLFSGVLKNPQSLNI